jgi:hypothetical protein
VEEIPRVVFDESRAEGKLQPGEKHVYVYLTRDNVDFYFGEQSWWDIPLSKNRWKKTSAAADAAYRKIY